MLRVKEFFYSQRPQKALKTAKAGPHDVIMNIISLSQSAALMEVTKDDLIMINSALNETCNGIELFEFETRIGFDRERVKRLLNEIGLLIDKIEDRESGRA